RFPLNVAIREGSLPLREHGEADPRRSARVRHLEAHRSRARGVPAAGSAPSRRPNHRCVGRADGITQPVVQASRRPGRGDGPMKLSDKLAALEAADREATRRKEVPAAVTKPGQRPARAAEKGPNKWSDAKRKV